MHVRGSSLSQPAVVETLRPFIVAFWGQGEKEPIPPDVLPLYEASGYGHSNVRCFVLDSEGRLLHAFNGFPGVAGNPLAFTPEQYIRYFTGEIARGSAGITLPRVDAAMKLPDLKNGVRLFIRLPGRQGSYGYPVVETVENRDEWKALAYPQSPREIDAGRLMRWLRLCFPPGVNEQLKPYGFGQGTLTLKPVGKNQAILSGRVKLGRSETDLAVFDGAMDAVLTYGTNTTLRGVVEGVYWRHDKPHNRWMDWKLTAAIESRPD